MIFLSGKPTKGGVEPADSTKSTRTFVGGTRAEVIDCPVDIDDYWVPPSVMPMCDDGKIFYFLFNPLYLPLWS